MSVGSPSPELRRTLGQAEAEAESWFNGPPYAVVEHVFDEDSIKGCMLEPPPVEADMPFLGGTLSATARRWFAEVSTGKFLMTAVKEERRTWSAARANSGVLIGSRLSQRPGRRGMIDGWAVSYARIG